MITAEKINDLLKSPYRVRRKVVTEFIISNDLTMVIETSVNINSDQSLINNSHHISFKLRGMQEELEKGDVFDMLKEKYFKPKMVIY